MIDDETRNFLNKKRQEQRSNLSVGETQSICINFDDLTVKQQKQVNDIIHGHFGPHAAMNMVFAQIKVLTKK